MKKSKLIVGLLIAGLTLSVLSCKDDDGKITEPCGEFAVISEDYANNPSYNITILDASITDDCLEVSISASGCDGSTWETDMYATTLETENGIPSVAARVDLVNSELCDAIVNKDVFFDLSLLQITSTNSVVLYLDGWDAPLEYTY